MSIKIDKRIVGAGLKAPASAPDPGSGEVPAKTSGADVIQMHERLERPETLVGSTYKIKTPLSEHALYVTINDIVLNEGTRHEQRRPFEIFINSKNMEHFQWIVALTRIISAVFRKGGDVTFLVEELHSVFDPKGGYFKRGGKYMPSLVAEIGDAIESHLLQIGLLKKDEPDARQRAHLEAKRQEFIEATASTSGGDVHRAAAAERSSGFPAGSMLCEKCQTQAAIMMDGCLTCLNCGYSKCS